MKIQHKLTTIVSIISVSSTIFGKDCSISRPPLHYLGTGFESRLRGPRENFFWFHKFFLGMVDYHIFVVALSQAVLQFDYFWSRLSSFRAPARFSQPRFQRSETSTAAVSSSSVICASIHFTYSVNAAISPCLYQLKSFKY